MSSLMTPRLHVMPIWVHARAEMGSREQAVKCLVSRAVSTCVTKHLVTIFSYPCKSYVIILVTGYA